MKGYLCADIRFAMTHVPNNLIKHPAFFCCSFFVSISVLLGSVFWWWNINRLCAPPLLLPGCLTMKKSPQHGEIGLPRFDSSALILQTAVKSNRKGFSEKRTLDGFPKRYQMLMTHRKLSTQDRHYLGISSTIENRKLLVKCRHLCSLYFS